MFCTPTGWQGMICRMLGEQLDLSFRPKPHLWSWSNKTIEKMVENKVTYLQDILHSNQVTFQIFLDDLQTDNPELSEYSGAEYNPPRY